MATRLRFPFCGVAAAVLLGGAAHAQPLILKGEYREVDCGSAYAVRMTLQLIGNLELAVAQIESSASNRLIISSILPATTRLRCFDKTGAGQILRVNLRFAMQGDLKKVLVRTESQILYIEPEP